MLKAALVDLDGTLVDTHAAILGAYEQALDGLAYDADKLRQSVGKVAWRDLLARVMPHGSAEQHHAVALRKRLLYPEFFGLVTVNTALVQVLTSLKPDVVIALVTAASRGSVEPLLAAKSLTGLFDLVVTSDDVARQKPDPEPYRLAAERLGVSARDCVAFEDSETGLASARAFGCQTWQVHWPG